MIEMILVVVILGILSLIAAGIDHFLDVKLAAQAGLLRNQIRYAQVRAMKQGVVHGLASNSTGYWLFSGTDTTNRLPLPGETSLGVALDADLSLNTFTLFFDNFGRPFSAYASSSSNTPVTTASPLNIQLTYGSQSETLSITEETGFVP